MSRRPTSDARPRLLLFGPRPIRGDVIGGTKVLFARNERRFAESGRFRVAAVDTSRPFARWGAGDGGARRLVLDLLGLARVLAHLALRVRRADVVLFNASSGGVLRAGPLVHILCRAARTPLVFRLFGADFGAHWDRATPLTRWVARRTVLRADLFLLETEALCRRFSAFARTRRFANTRDVRGPRGRGASPSAQPVSSARGARFGFVGQVRLEKGLKLALDASDALPEGCALEVFGPLLPGVEPELFEAHPRVSYGGVLEPEDVPAALSALDALVFPTLYETEGMPGVVLEAMQCGVPVIASRWGAAEELVEDGVSGLLVPQGSVADLAEAMRRVADDPALREALARGARERGDAFRCGPWHARLEDWLAALAGEEPPAEAPRRTLREAA